MARMAFPQKITEADGRVVEWLPLGGRMYKYFNVLIALLGTQSEAYVHIIYINIMTASNHSHSPDFRSSLGRHIAARALL